jgi:hypothetical protein
MQLHQAELLGFVQLDLGSMAVQVPVRVAKGEEAAAEPLASFQQEGDACAIIVRGDTSSTEVSAAMKRAAQDAIRHFSRKLLN